MKININDLDKKMNGDDLKEVTSLGVLDCRILDILSIGIIEDEEEDDIYINSVGIQNEILKEDIKNGYHDYKFYNEDKSLRVYFDIIDDSEIDCPFGEPDIEYIEIKYRDYEVIDLGDVENEN